MPEFNVGPLSARQRNETEFKWRFPGGPMIARLWWYLDPSSPHQLKKKNKQKVVKVGPLLTNCLEPHRIGGNRKNQYYQGTYIDQESTETAFSIAICRHTSDKWQSKTLFISFFDPRFSIVYSVFDCRLPGVGTAHEIVHYFSSYALKLFRYESYISDNRSSGFQTS